jgi:predicted RNA-binding protein with RPS1 domain
MAPRQPSVRNPEHRPDGQGSDHPHQPGNPPHLARHEAARVDPWDGIGAKFPVGKKISGTVTNITDYGAFVELEPGIEGLIHVSEMSWTKKNVHPGKILSRRRRKSTLSFSRSIRPSAASRSASSRRSRTRGRHSRRAIRLGTEGRGRGQEQDRVRPVHRPRRRRGRHGASLRPRLEPSGRAGHRRVQQGRHGQGCRSRCGRREGAHLARHQAAWQGYSRRSC